MPLEHLDRASSPATTHELLRVFAARGFELNPVLNEMLSEHHKHCTERRGCGFTQATRHLAEHVNKPRSPSEYDEVRLFAERDPSRVHWLVQRATEAELAFSWRHLDQREAPSQLADDPTFLGAYRQEAEHQARLRRLPEAVELEESRLLAGIVRDLVVPVEPSGDADLVVLPGWPDKLAIGTCPLAEKYFLELSDRFVRRRGRMNILVDEQGQPVLVEKLNLGDNHSCVSLREVVLNGVRLPPGSLVGVTYEGEPALRRCRELAGNVIPVDRCAGFRFLRLTTLAVSPKNRARAFTKHFQAQVEGGLFAPGTVTIAQLLGVAKEQL